MATENENRLEERYQMINEELQELKSNINTLQNDLENKESQVQFQLKVNDLLREQNGRYLI